LPTDLKKGLSIATEGAVIVTSPKDFNSKVGSLLEEKNQISNPDQHNL
jgi:hypothetical protein